VSLLDPPPVPMAEMAQRLLRSRAYYLYQCGAARRRREAAEINALFDLEEAEAALDRIEGELKGMGFGRLLERAPPDGAA
jgi:hypothetical protein